MRKIMKHLAPSVLHLHAPSAIHKLGAEHVIMSGVYGLAAVMVHHPVGSVAVSIGYLTTGVLAYRAQQ